jgi:hypothetical protein
MRVVAQAEIHKGVGRVEVIAIRAFPRMDELPLRVILRGNLVALLLDELHGPDGGASRNGAVDGHANLEVALVGFLEGGLIPELYRDRFILKKR